jgi:hypothetical protein
MNIETIKQLAADRGVSYRDLIVLAPANDPFYVGTPGDIEKGQWFADIWRAAGYGRGVHLRRAHYWAVSQPDLLMPDGNPYENTDRCWRYLCQAAKLARYLGLVRIADIKDAKNPAPLVNAQYWGAGAEYEVEAPDLDDPAVKIYGINNSYAQPYHLEVWCEKSTMDDVLRPICSQYGANLATFEGEVSVTACHDLIERILTADKPARIFYISDFDPAGQSMPVATARKIEWMIHDRGLDLDVMLKPIVLTADQVKQYRLPRTPIKDSELRAGAFEDVHGAGAVELDALEALHPGALRSIVAGALREYYSDEAARHVRRLRDELWQAVTARVAEVTARYADQIAALETMTQELRAVDVDASAYDVATFEPHVVEDSAGWLFDSGRDYLDQIDAYKAFKGGDA